MTRTPQQRRKKPGLWDRAQLAPRIPPPDMVVEEKRCDCGHLVQLHEGWLLGKPKKCCYMGVGGRDRCQCKKYVKP